MAIGREIDGHIPGEQEWKPLTAQQVNLLQFENGKLKARNAALESAIRGLVEGTVADGGSARCTWCMVRAQRHPMKHVTGCKAKPALDLVFGPCEGGGMRGER